MAFIDLPRINVSLILYGYDSIINDIYNNVGTT